jgi:hypothetical protein
LVANVEQKQFCKFRLVWEKNINMDLKATKFVVEKSIHLAQQESCGKDAKKLMNIVIIIIIIIIIYLSWSWATG